jgi:peroxiredoxin
MSGGSDRFRLATNKGRIVIISFWDSAAPSVLVLNSLKQLSQQYKKGELEIIALNSADSDAEVRDAVNRLAIGYSVARDRAQEILAKYGVKARPTTFIVDGEGKVTEMFVGPVGWRALSGRVSKLIGPPEMTPTAVAAAPATPSKLCFGGARAVSIGPTVQGQAAEATVFGEPGRDQTRYHSVEVEAGQQLQIEVTFLDFPYTYGDVALYDPQCQLVESQPLSRAARFSVRQIPLPGKYYIKVVGRGVLRPNSYSLSATLVRSAAAPKTDTKVAVFTNNAQQFSDLLAGLQQNYMLNFLGEGFPYEQISRYPVVLLLVSAAPKDIVAAASGQLKDYVSEGGKLIVIIDSSGWSEMPADVKTAWHLLHSFGIEVTARSPRGTRYRRPDIFFTKYELAENVDTFSYENWDDMYLRPTNLAQVLAYTRRNENFIASFEGLGTVVAITGQIHEGVAKEPIAIGNLNLVRNLVSLLSSSKGIRDMRGPRQAELQILEMTPDQSTAFPQERVTVRFVIANIGEEWPMEWDALIAGCSLQAGSKPKLDLPLPGNKYNYSWTIELGEQEKCTGKWEIVLTVRWQSNPKAESRSIQHSIFLGKAR